MRFRLVKMKGVRGMHGTEVFAKEKTIYGNDTQMNTILIIREGYWYEL